MCDYTEKIDHWRNAIIGQNGTGSDLQHWIDSDPIAAKCALSAWIWFNLYHTCIYVTTIHTLVTHLSQEIDPLFEGIMEYYATCLSPELTYLKDDNPQDVALSRNHGKAWNPIFGQRKGIIPTGQSECGQQLSPYSAVHDTTRREWRGDRWAGSGEIPCRHCPECFSARKTEGTNEADRNFKKRAVCFDSHDVLHSWLQLRCKTVIFYDIQNTSHTSPMRRKVCFILWFKGIKVYGLMWHYDQKGVSNHR